MRRLQSALWLAACLACACGQGAPDPAADLVLTGGTVHTVVEDGPAAEAIAIHGDRILAVGTEGEIAKLIGEGTEVIDLSGATAIPGLIESHGHFLGMGDRLRQVDLAGAQSWEEVVDLVAAAAAGAEPGSWVRGRGWHQEKWSSAPADAFKGFPVHKALSRRTPDNPVLLAHASSHAALVNAAAMERIGVDRRSASPEGGEIVLGPEGEPTGLLVEAAEMLAIEAWRADNEDSPQVLAELVAVAAGEAIEHGVTTFVDAGTPLARLKAMAPLFADGKANVRLWAMIRDDNRTLAGSELPPADDWFRVGGIKVSLDGALGSRGAWLLAPYSDAPDESGFQLVSLESLRRTAEIALERGLQLGVHAIGDRANREVLDLYEEFLGNSRNALRWRVEHAQNIHPDDIPRFAELGVIASVQGIHCTSDAPWVPQRLGDERAAERAYRWRDLIDSGAVVVNGTDVPVEPIDPFASLAASIDRRAADGRQFYPEQAMTPFEALASYTRDAAFAIKAEDELGTLEAGKLGDLVVLDRDPLASDPGDLRQARVLRTIVGGRTVYEAE